MRTSLEIPPKPPHQPPPLIHLIDVQGTRKEVAKAEAEDSFPTPIYNN
jgi:hypothetical protein